MPLGEIAPLKLHPADERRVLCANGIDLVVIWTAGLIAGLGTGGGTATVAGMSSGTNGLSAIASALLVGALTGFAIELLTARTSGRTIGRIVAGLVLVTTSGQRMGFGDCFVRATTSMFSALFFGAGYFWVLLNPQHRSWHDLVSGSIMVPRKVSVVPQSKPD